MRNYENELASRVAFIREVLSSAGADGIVYGNSGGKDSALVGILCKRACENTLGLIMPCGIIRNYVADKPDAETLAKHYGITTRTVDLSGTRNALALAVGKKTKLTDAASANIAPRLRMTTLYAIATAENRLVAGTGNRSEVYMGYFTKWGDGACDFNPIADLTVTEIYEFLQFLDVPDFVIQKAPSAGLFDGQTDEGEMGLTYRSIDAYLLSGETTECDRAIIEKLHSEGEHKHNMPIVYTGKV